MQLSFFCAKIKENIFERDFVMRTLLLALNAKYIHSNIAVRYLQNTRLLFFASRRRF